MPDEEYHGWPNYPTWAAFMWLSNKPAQYNIVKGMDPEDLKAWVCTVAYANLSRATLEMDLLSWAIAKIDWNHLAEALKEE